VKEYPDKKIHEGRRECKIRKSIQKGGGVEGTQRTYSFKGVWERSPANHQHTEKGMSRSTEGESAFRRKFKMPRARVTTIQQSSRTAQVFRVLSGRKGLENQKQES